MPLNEEEKLQCDRNSVSTLPSLQKKCFFLMETFRNVFFKSVFWGVFWKDNAKGFLNMLSKVPVHVSKLV